jgi:hypothetical protein
MPRSLLLAALTALALTAVVPRVASGEVRDHAATLKEIQTLTDEAATAFEAYSYRKAQAKLEKALALATTAGVSRDTKMADVHIMLGVAAVAGTNDLYRGLHAFVQALRLNPQAAVPKKLATPQLLEMLAKARQTVKEIGKPPTIRFSQAKERAGEGRPAQGATGLVHSPIDTARRGFPIPVKAEVGVDIQAQRLILYYRGAGTVQFQTLTMQKSGSTFRIAIPAELTVGRYIHYYLEARDARGRLAASFGSARSPTVVIIQ